MNMPSINSRFKETKSIYQQRYSITHEDKSRHERIDRSRDNLIRSDRSKPRDISKNYKSKERYTAHKISKERIIDQVSQKNDTKLITYVLIYKNYFEYFKEHFYQLKEDLEDKVKDISDIKFDEKIPGFQDHALSLYAPTHRATVDAILIIAEYFFRELKKHYSNMTYVKLSILVPDNVISYIIGIHGRNLNEIRDKVGTKIEVYPSNELKELRQIEISGTPKIIAKAAEYLYEIVYKYINFKMPAKNIYKNYRKFEENYQRNKKYYHSDSSNRSNENHYIARKSNSTERDHSTTPKMDKADKESFEMKLKEGNPIKEEKSEDVKLSMNIILFEDSISIINKQQTNLWIDLENQYNCSISKKTENYNGKEASIITFTGTPEENSFALYELQNLFLKNLNSK